MMRSLRQGLTLILFWLTLPGGARAQNVLVNQAGYLTDQKKEAYCIGTADSFHVVSQSGGSVAFSGPLQLTSTSDPATGLRTSKADFTTLNRPGIYRITTNLGDTSGTFAVGNTVFDEAYRKSLKGFYFQRCGEALLAQYAGAYARATCHMHDATFHSSTGKTGSASTGGGWHDAGDYGKYVVNAGISVGTLLLGYEMFPQKFSQDDLNIPESGNGVPDLLDEVRYELEWILEMQDTVDGGVYFKVTTANFDGFEMPSQDAATRYIYQKSSTATGDFAAIMAQAGRIYAPFDTAFASRCVAAARLAWDYLVLNPGIVPPTGFHNPSGTATGEYGDGSDTDERLWAATELFETTGEATFNSYFLTHYTAKGVFTSTMGWPNVQTMAQIDYLVGKQATSDSAAQSVLRSGLASYCASLVGRAATDGLNVTLATWEYAWGSNSNVLNNAILLIVGYGISGNASYSTTALEQLNYILGCNCKAMSYLTGVGARSPMHIHHRPSAADGIAAPVPGLLAGGPDEWRDDAVLQANYTSASPPASCYIDDQGSYASNEICINWNAPLVFVAGYFNESPASSVKSEGWNMPGNFRLEQNYPNPFNPKTVISGQWTADSGVRLEVFDILGRKVATLADGRYPAGKYAFTFEGTNLASGVYLYRLTAGSFSAVREMVLVR